jgi:hypothetical protein
MKNLHILPTNKPSRLHTYKGVLNLAAGEFVAPTIAKNDLINQHIYITSDEEIKEGDWILFQEILTKALEGEKFSGKEKIILTTDPDLIKNNIQAIDDEFLEWFVENPSCEKIEVQDWVNYYKIFIPKEEPKQETLEEYLQVCKDCGSEEVARCKWVNVNTEEIYSADSGTTLEWCFNCKNETNIIDKKKYAK